ncbi:MAG TPA: hypothetical protein VH702_00875 [Vicinamibacterales bacterium]|jgi:hypothetical protein
MKAIFMLLSLVVLTVGCEQSMSPTVPSDQPETPNTPAPPPQPAKLTCADAEAVIYNGPDPDKAHARITAPAGEWATNTLFELLAYPTPLVDQRDVNSTGRWPVTPGTTAELQTDKPAEKHQIDVRCNDQVIASATGE